MSSKKVSLINILSQLLKCCNHPYLFENEPETNSKEEEHKRLVEASAKLYLLDKMLEKLKKQGNRVLIFSQSTRVLDILEDYLTYKNHNFVRIDGQVAVSNRQAAIDKFNNENSSVFCFLLSTRACRLGINLASADTVVFYDSDWYVVFFIYLNFYFIYFFLLLFFIFSVNHYFYFIIFFVLKLRIYLLI